ncbi:chondrolectin-like [Penaeus japonicus]|uniref:chondrolectin-like n=1 Tax=Penaeus japonicus TaxID=27405 RepID=UPI001C70F855|nr:chondrolectin-like [Penaeus japonicus]
MRTPSLLLQGSLCLLLGLLCVRAVPRSQLDSVQEKKINAIHALIDILTEVQGEISAGETKKVAAGGEEEGDLVATLKDLATAVKNNTKALLKNVEEKGAEDESQFFWVGASTNGTGDEWHWVSGSDVARGDWALDQPDGGNEDCVVLSRDEFPALHDSPCYTQTMFICEKPVVLTN